MSTFDRLHAALQHHVVNTLGWPELRPLQEMTIDPLLAGEDALLLAPTAGGKTEAAFFPLVSRMLDEDWRGLSVVYVCPIKALLNNLEIRLRHYCELVGRRCASWHGDTTASARKKLLVEPPDCLLTTPESLEVILTTRGEAARALFEGLRAVVVDEIHAFAGDDRGWHLLAVLERVEKVAGRELQRVGLSATVGNPEALLGWLRGARGGEGGHVLDPSRREEGGAAVDPGENTDVQLDYVGSLENAAKVIARLHRQDKRLVFVDSRSRVERLAYLLRQEEVETYVSHSSLSLDQRRRAEAAFAEASGCVIVATSTLELGIDVGDLDRIVQIDAPATVASFLQRLGRTGRRGGAQRNALFLATRNQTLLQAAALLELWERGYVEPIVPPAKPLHILAQQIMALALQEDGIGRGVWQRWLRGSIAATGITQEETDQIVAHMLEREILSDDQGLMWLGGEGEKTFGRRHFMELFSVFTSPPLFHVQHGRQEVGVVDPMSFMARKRDEPLVLLLAGRGWKVKHIDWPRRVAWVEPTEEKGTSRWSGGANVLSFEMCQAMRRILATDDPAPRWSKRARDRMAEIREEFPWAKGDAEATVLVQEKDGTTTWWTFAGYLANAALGDALCADRPASVTYDNLSIRFRHRLDPADLRRSLDRLRPHLPDLAPQADLTDALDGLKFSSCLPRPLAESQIRTRLRDLDATQRIASTITRSFGGL